jgi:hypothetical protein
MFLSLPARRTEVMPARQEPLDSARLPLTSPPTLKLHNLSTSPPNFTPRTTEAHTEAGYRLPRPLEIPSSTKFAHSIPL